MIVYTGGTFDLFHYGHVNFLEEACKLGRVVVSLNTDEFIHLYKGRTPIMPYEQRKALLESCQFVAKVVENIGGADSKPAILSVQPDIIAIGSDWARKNYYQQMQFTQDWLDEQNIKLCYIPYTKGISTTMLRSEM